MSIILEADENGTLHLPAAILPKAGLLRRYRVAAENGHVVVDEAPADFRPWMELAGCLAGESEERRRIDRVIEEGCEQINPEDWK